MLPDRLNALKSGEQYLEFALPWDTITSAPFEEWQKNEVDVPALQKRSSDRVSSQKDFRLIAAETAQGSKQQEKSLRPLNIDAARRERDEAQLKAKQGAAHGSMQHGDRSSYAGLSTEEKQKKWMQEVNEDIYVQEAISVLDDLRSASFPVNSVVAETPQRLSP